MYCLVLIIPLAMAAPRVSRNCYTLCDLQKAHPSNVAPRDCNCSLSALMDAESVSEEITLLNDTGVYYVPAEVDFFQAQFTPQPFLISNPVKFNPKINRIKKGSVAKKDSSDETSERVDTYEKRKSFIRVSNNDGSQPPSYLDLEIQDVASSETSVIRQGNFIPTFESAEKALVECLDLHILQFTRKYGSVENFNEIWEARNLKIYEDLSNSDLNDKIKKYCSETENLIEQSLQDIKRGVPKKQIKFKYIPEDEDDISKKHETKESTESFEFRSSTSMTESSSIHDSRTDQPSLLNTSIEHNLLAKQNVDNFVSKNKSTLEGSSSPYLSHNTSPTADNVNESKGIDINFRIAENTLSDVTIVTTKNTAKAYDTEFDMDTMPSEVIFKTINEINQFDFEMATNKPNRSPNSDETAIFSISTTPLSDVLSFRDTSSITEKSFAEKQEDSPRKDIVFNLNTLPSGDVLKINNQMNESNNEIVKKEPVFDENILRTPQNEEQSLGDIRLSTEISVAKKGERTIETTEFSLVTKPLANPFPLSSPNKTNESNINMVSNEIILDNASLFPALTTSKYEKLSLEDLSSNSESPITEKQEYGKDEEGNELDLDLDTKPAEFILKSNNETDKISNERILDNITFYSTSTTPKSEEILPGDISSNTETSKAEKVSEDEGMQLNFVTMSPNITFKPFIERFTPHFDEAGNELTSDDIPLSPTASTSSQKYEVSLETATGNTERPVTELPQKHVDGNIYLDINTMASNVMNIANSRSILDDTFKFATTSKTSLNEKPLINIHEETISSTSSEEDISVSIVATTPVIAIQSQHRNKFKESEVQIPTIVTKECQNNVVQSFINGNEALPNNDFEHTDGKSQSMQKKVKQVSSDDYSELNPNSSVEEKDAKVVFNNSYVTGNLYFGTSQELVPVRLLQTDSGKVSLGIDGHSLCEKLYKSNMKSLLLSTLCDFVHKMTKNNSTEYLNK